VKHITDIRELKLIANTLRQDVIRMLAEAGSGHTAGPLGMADIFAALYFNVAKHNPKNPKWPERDRIILSNGHICPIRYAAMARSGYFPVEELKTLRKLGSRLQGHPHINSLPGLETSAGPLGQNVSVACGMAYAAKMDKKEHKIFLITSDGEHDEGQTWEAILFAAKYRLDNLINVVDQNYIQISGHTYSVMPLDSLKKKYKAFGWRVFEIHGNNMKQILHAYKKALVPCGKPTVIIADTIPGKGVSFFEDKYEWHGKAPSAEEGKLALIELEEEREHLLK
jgi:transketolase